MLANPKLDAPSLDRTSREIAALCEKHAVPCGAPEDLANLLHALGQNKLLAMEFWALVARVTDRDPAAATNNSLLAVIVEAVSGQTLDEANSASGAGRLLVRKLANMLAGEDIHAPIAPGPFAAARDLNSNPKREVKPDPAPAASGRIAAARDLSSSPKREVNPDPAPTVPGPIAAARNLSSNPKGEAKPDPAPLAAPLPHRNPQLRLVLDPEAPLAAKADPEHQPGNAAPFAIPLSAYAEPGAERSPLPRVLAGILLLAAIAGGFFALHRTAGSKTHASSNPAPHPAAAAPVPQASIPQVQTPAPLPQAKPTSPPVAVAPHSAPATLAPASPRTSERPAENAATEAASEKPQVVVPEALMRQNLISSRVPVVPGNATPHGIVVLDAVITSRGTVEHLRAIEGDPALRRAAIDAASAWHYRPYLLNGTPVDVSTTISVDFAGDN